MCPTGWSLRRPARPTWQPTLPPDLQVGAVDEVVVRCVLLWMLAGTCPGIFIMESMIDLVAKTLGLDPDTVRRANLYKKDQVQILL